MLQYILFFGLFLLACAQLFMLFCSRRKKRAALKRFLLTCFACMLVYHVPDLFERGMEKLQKRDVFSPTLVSFAQTGEPKGYPERAGAEGQIVYYNQEDPRWGEKTYGPVDKIMDAGCGPTVLAMAVSSLTEQTMNPEEMCQWAYENGYCSVGSGSYHGLIGEGLSHFGIENQTTNSGEVVRTALETGHPVIALMGEGHFTSGGHFILLCDMDGDGMVSVADPKSVERTEKKWDLDLILEEAKASPVTGGAFWILQI